MSNENDIEFKFTPKKEKGNNNNNLYTHHPTENKYASLQKHAASKKNNKNARY